MGLAIHVGQGEIVLRTVRRGHNSPQCDRYRQPPTSGKKIQI
jgi:hypothetical protein